MRISDWSSDVCSSDLLDQRAGDAQADRTGLAGGAAAAGGDEDVEALGVLGQLERLAHDHARGLAAEELVERTLVDGDLAGAAAQEHAGGGGLATAGAVILGDCHRSEEHTSELQSLMRISYAVFCLKNKNTIHNTT